jgi:undecaprenyl-diphosphatase
MFEPVAEIVMTFGTIVALIVLVPLAYLRFSSVGPALELFAALAAARTIGQWAKHAFGTGRPAIADGITIREAADGFGFPSVHATIAFAMASVWCARGDRRDRFVAIPLAFGVGLGRWYVGAHFVVDVVGGAALGVVVGVLTRLIADRLTVRR